MTNGHFYLFVLNLATMDLVGFFIEYVGTDDFSAYEEQYGRSYLKQVVLCQKVIDYLAENAVLA